MTVRIPLLLGLTALIAAGCGDDSTPPPDAAGVDGTTPADGGPDATVMPACPSGDTIPDPEGFMGPCCYRKSNASDLANPELRLVGVGIDRPTSLGNPIISAALSKALNEENFNWLIRIQGADADGDITITTGFGFRDPGPVFRFANGDAPAPGDPARYDPIMVTGTITGETITAPEIMGSFTVPILDTDGVTVALELPLHNLSLQSMTLSEDRSCVGIRRGNSYSTMDGELTTYVLVSDSLMGMVDFEPIHTSLCNLLAGQSTDMTKDCETTPQDMWNVPPDSMCDATTCTQGGCAATECNAWQVHSGFAAHGVEIMP